MGKPVLVNLNSFKNLQMILEQLHENVIKNSEREVVCWNRLTSILLDEKVARKETI